MDFLLQFLSVLVTKEIEMTPIKVLFILIISKQCCCDWINDWMSPLQREIKPKYNNGKPPQSALQFDDLGSSLENIMKSKSPHKLLSVYGNAESEKSEDIDANILKKKLENTLNNAKMLLDSLQEQIVELSEKETVLKEAIVNGRYGVSLLKVSTMVELPRTYIVRDNSWRLCDGLLKLPNTNVHTSFFVNDITEPKCLGHEVRTERDPCVFHSIIKYETIPTKKLEEYNEDNYFCLKTNFNSTVEHYLSVPRTVVNSTCDNGLIRSLDENLEECGVRTLYEYTYYPHKNAVAAELPLEYCLQDDGSCKLIIGWDLKNGTVNNFEYLKDEVGFKNNFMDNNSLKTPKEQY